MCFNRTYPVNNFHINFAGNGLTKVQNKVMITEFGN